MYPYIGGLFAAGLWIYFDLHLPRREGYVSEVLSSGLTLGAILTGFLATSKTILIGLRDSSIMRELRDSSYMSDLVSYLAQAIWLCFTFSILSITGFFLLRPSDYWFDAIWIGAGVAGILAFVRVTRIIFLILSHDSEEEAQ
ncbi:MAG: hypothetical protein R3268_00165 [Acidiferrobacterales bacterium]|nr:hypothetical protein [Acidiferrobacterales bacterium]